MIIREIAFSFILFVSSSKTTRNRAVSIFKSCFNTIITSQGVIIARYDAILDQSERAHLYNHLQLSNYAKIYYTNSNDYIPYTNHVTCTIVNKKIFVTSTMNLICLTVLISIARSHSLDHRLYLLTKTNNERVCVKVLL